MCMYIFYYKCNYIFQFSIICITVLLLLLIIYDLLYLLFCLIIIIMMIIDIDYTQQLVYSVDDSESGN